MGTRRLAAVLTLLACLAAAPTPPAEAYDEADLKRVLSDGHCPGCDLSGAEIVDEDLRKAYLPGADFSGANLLVTTFAGADLSGADLEGADLSLGVFTGAILDGANLRGAKVEGADFAGASLSGADVTGVVWDGASGADLRQAIGAPAGATTPPAPPQPKPAPPATVALSPAPAAMKSQQLGTSFLTAGSFCPAGTLEADGATLSLQQHVALFSLLGATYGGDGRTTFKLPDMRPQVPLAGLRYCIVADGAYPPHP